MTAATYCPACGSADTDHFDGGLLWCKRCGQLLYRSELVGKLRAFITRLRHQVEVPVMTDQPIDSDFEVDVTFKVKAASLDDAWQKVYDALIAADEADGGRSEGKLPMWEMIEGAARPVRR